MRFRYKSGLMLIFLLIVTCATLIVSYKVYKENFYKEAVVVVDGDLTINYLDGNKFKSKKDLTLNFSVTNNGSEEASFYIKLANINADDTTYELKEVDGTLEIDNKLASSIVSNQLLIEGNTTKTYKLEIKPKKRTEYSGELMVALGSKNNATFGDIIIDNSNIKKNPTTKFNTSAVENEGLIKVKNDEGTSYYFRGNIVNNYVSFADLTWRIVGINSDGSVKLVLDSLLADKYSYGESSEYNNSNISQALNSFYNNSLNKYSEVIAVHYFCNDLLKDDDGSYAAYLRISKNFIPNNMCLGTKISSNIGLLTADEVVLAGASETENTAYYLYNPEIKDNYYTMTSAVMKNTSYYPYIVKTNGAIAYDSASTNTLGVRPVINIIKNISANGDGTKENPYILMDIS